MDEAYKFVCDKHFHQCLWLPVTAEHPRLRVTFSTTTNFEDGNMPAVLMCNPMFGTRYFAQDMNHLAKRAGVRMIFVDRPGMGGSTNIPRIDKRVAVWLETVPLVLERLKVKHVSIVTHSAGAIYALNTIYHLRHILDPQRPYAAFMAPWVHNSHSNATLMNIVAMIPNGVMNQWTNLNTFIAGKIIPATSWSGGTVSSVASLFQSPENAGLSTKKLAEKYGVDGETATKIEQLQGKFSLAEDRQAGTEDAKLCLKKDLPGAWLACEDYDEYVRSLLALERDRPKDAGAENLEIDAFFAGSDIMIGSGGAAYFKRCFSQTGVSEHISFNPYDLPDTDHETVIADFDKGAMGFILEKVKSQFAEEASKSAII